MSVSNDPSPVIEAAGLPADPSAYRRPGPMRWWLILGGVAVWTVICVGGAIYIVNLSKGGPGKAPVVSPINLPFVGHPAEPPAPAPVVAQPAPPPEVASDAALADRVARLEGDQQRVGQAAASALAAATLSQAAQSSAPFETELAQAMPLLPAQADIGGLQRLARTGAPTRAALAAEFADTVSKAAQAAKAPSPDAGLLAKIGHALSQVVTIRRVEDTTGLGSDAVLNRAQRALDDGDLEAAVADVDKLNAPARQVLARWRERAQRRLEIDHQVAALRTSAVRELAASSGVR